MFAKPANQISAVASQANGGIAGNTPGSGDDWQWNTQAIRHGQLPLWPVPPINGSAQSQGVGTDVLDAMTGNPAIRLGNIYAVLSNGTVLAECSAVFLDEHGNTRITYDAANGPRMWAADGSFLGYPAYTATSWW